MTKNRAPKFSMETVDGRTLRVAVWRARKATTKLQGAEITFQAGLRVCVWGVGNSDPISSHRDDAM